MNNDYTSWDRQLDMRPDQFPECIHTNRLELLSYIRAVKRQVKSSLSRKGLNWFVIDQILMRMTLVSVIEGYYGLTFTGITLGSPSLIIDFDDDLIANNLYIQTVGYIGMVMAVVFCYDKYKFAVYGRPKTRTIPGGKHTRLIWDLTLPKQNGRLTDAQLGPTLRPQNRRLTGAELGLTPRSQHGRRRLFQ
jgi:hypothetical protein